MGKTIAKVRPWPMMRAFGGSALVTARLLARHQLRLPRGHIGDLLHFSDGTISRVYLETVRNGTSTRQPTLLVVQFRLRLIGHNVLLHALFRLESIANTPLFAGFPGFRTKLWATDEQTGVYRGIYEWDGLDEARNYATTLTALLRPFCAPGSVEYHIEPGVRRDEYLRNPAIVGGAAQPPVTLWWLLERKTVE